MLNRLFRGFNRFLAAGGVEVNVHPLYMYIHHILTYIHLTHTSKHPIYTSLNTSTHLYTLLHTSKHIYTPRLEDSKSDREAKYAQIMAEVGENGTFNRLFRGVNVLFRSWRRWGRMVQLSFPTFPRLPDFPHFPHFPPSPPSYTRLVFSLSLFFFFLSKSTYFGYNLFQRGLPNSTTS